MSSSSVSLASPLPKRTTVFLSLALVQILFGMNYVFSKQIIGVIPPLVWACLRNLVSGICLLGFALLIKRPAPKLSRDYLFSLTLYSFLGIVVSQAAFLTGLAYTTATNSSIINTLIPVVTLLLVSLKGSEALSKGKFVFFMIAFSGVLVIRKIEQFSLSDQTMVGDSLVFVNCIAAAFYITLSKPFVKANDTLWAMVGMFLIGSLGLGLLGFSQWVHFHWPPMNVSLWMSIFFSIFGSTLLAYLLNFWALRHAQSTSVALFIYLQPVVASILASLVLGEVITGRTVASSGLILIGMLGAMIQR